MTEQCKVCNGLGQVDDYRNNTIRCPMCAWPLAKCHGTGCDGQSDCAVVELTAEDLMVANKIAAEISAGTQFIVARLTGGARGQTPQG